jgi:hypothetical protein
MPRSSPIAIKRPIFTPSTPSAPVQRETSLMGAVKEGFGWGVGTSVARSLFGGAPTTTIVQQQPQKSEPTEFERCIAEHKDDMGEYKDKIAACAHLAQKK